MSFGGAVSAMITSLKNNKRTRVSAFDKIKNNTTKSKIKLHFNKEATSEELLKIKENSHKKTGNNSEKTLLFLVF
ncbi:hypothetical protein [Polaribacter sp.]|uniref:hypothetical protein n=1 Tax=Polaribacter sp. TaxID=1920175 RepID=UPI003F6BF897